MNKTSKYTYADFANDIIALMKDEIELTAEKRKAISAKASALLTAQVNKAEYNATHKSTKTAKGASAETKQKAETIKSVLTSTPMTTAEINAKLGSDFSALQVANACKFIEGCHTCKVVRSTVNSKGLKAEKEYTAYSVAE